MKLTQSFILLPLISLLTACGSGGSGDSFNSSFQGTVTINGQKYVCPTQKSYEACQNSDNRDCSACTSDNTSTDNTIITASCTAPTSNSYQVSQSGCIVNLATSKKTGICSTGSLKLLDGEGFTKTQVINQGVSFSSGVILNGISIKCAS